MTHHPDVMFDPADPATAAAIEGADHSRATAPVVWAGRAFGELTADEKRRAARAAGDRLSAELAANADAIGQVLDGDPAPVIPRVTVLHGHVSAETAYLVEDYPYGRRLRCRMRVWVDGPAEKGQYKGKYRVMRQTNNPRSARDPKPWNKPHASTYTDWVLLVVGDDDGRLHQHSGGFTYGLTGAQDARMRLDGTYGQLDDGQRKFYDVMVRIGQQRGRWDYWHKTVAMFRDHHARTGRWPTPDEVRAAGLYVPEGDYDVTAAEAAGR